MNERFSKVRSIRNRSGERGTAMILWVFAMTLVVLPMIGLAIDVTTLYMVRAKTMQAVDAASLAGARSLSAGQDVSSQQAAATAAANAYFLANMPNGMMGTANTVTAVVNQTSSTARTVTVTASTVAPTYFMRVAGVNTMNFGSSAQTTRRDINMMLVLDRSASMSLGSGGNVCPVMIADAQAFVSNFANGRDTLGLVSYMAGANVDYTFNLNFKGTNPTLSGVIGSLTCGGFTGSAEALSLAYQQIVNLNQPGRENVIVFFTDGQPNGINVSNAPVKRSADNRRPVQGYNAISAVADILVAASTCPASVTGLSGVIGVDYIGFPASGPTAGLFSPTPATTAAYDSGASPSGCASYAPGLFQYTSGNAFSMRNDLAYIPTTDAYGNSTTRFSPSSGTDYFKTGPYTGQLRPDQPITLGNASMSASYSAIDRIRADKTFNITIYSIGLGGTSGGLDEPNTNFLQYAANDPTGSSYDSTAPAGAYVYAPNSTQLASAYRTISAKVLRLSK